MKISASWRKAFRDLWINKTRSFLVVLALFVGVISVGTVSAAYSILIREMDKNYLYTEPASATLWVKPLDAKLVQAVADMPQFAKAEARSQIIGRFQIAPGEWRELWLYIIPDFNNVQVDKLTPEQGAWPPATGEILLERTAVDVAKARIGDNVIVKIPNQKERTLAFTGTVHMPGLPPAWVEGRVYGYITPDTLSLFGAGSMLDQLKITVAENGLDEAYIRQETYELKSWLEQNGHTVSSIEIPQPGKHPHADLMAAFISMLGACGLLVLAMSGILVTNMISSILAQQIRQIGIMKAIGGGARQIAGIYFSMVLVLGIVALVIGIPVSLALGSALADYEAVQMLNFQIFDNRVDLWVYGLVIATGLLIPVLAAAVPISKGSRITVLAALSDYGVGKGQFGASRIDIWLSRMKGGARTFLLSLRNVFRRRGRLVLTLLTLTVAGASFITAMNVSGSIDREVARKFEATPYDIQIAFSQSYPPGEIERVISQVGGVDEVETWGGAMAAIVLPDGTLGKQLSIAAPPINTQLSPKPQITKGRWLRPDDPDAIVMSEAALNLLNLDARIGNEIPLGINGQKTTWKLVGISKEFMGGSSYISFASYSHVIERSSQATYTVVKINDPASAEKVTKDLEITLSNKGYDVYTAWKTDDTRAVMEQHMVLITGILLLMAALFVIVGSLGLTSTMSLNVLERTRELGVIRAIGASTRTVLQIIISEGAFIGGLSWVLAVILSVPLSWLMVQIFNVIFGVPVALSVSGTGWGIWFVLIIVISSIASAFPAWSAARQPVNKVLAYE